MSKTGLIIKREYTSRVRKKSFLVITILMPLIIIGLLFLAMWVGLKDEKKYKALVADPHNWCNNEIPFETGGDPPVDFYFYESIILPEEFLADERFDNYDILIGIDDYVLSNHKVRVLYREYPSAKAMSFIEVNVGNRLREHYAMLKGHLSIDQYREIQQNFDFSFANIKDQEQAKEVQERAIVGFSFSILIYMFILIYSIQVMRGVIEEKSNRVVEIVVSSVRPFQLMMGKIIGIGLVGLTQFLIWIVLCAIGLIIIQQVIFPDIMSPENWEQVQQGMNNPDMGITTTHESIGQTSETADLILNRINWVFLISMFLVYFVGGYLVYASLFAMIGSAVDNEADTQQMVFPVILPLTFSYVIAVTVISNPMGAAATWFSMIPFTSPIVMLERVAIGTFNDGGLQVILSIVLLLGTALLMIWLAAKTYRIGILMYGKKASWREIIRWVRF